MSNEIRKQISLVEIRLLCVGQVSIWLMFPPCPKYEDEEERAIGELKDVLRSQEVPIEKNTRAQAHS